MSCRIGPIVRLVLLALIAAAAFSAAGHGQTTAPATGPATRASKPPATRPAAAEDLARRIENAHGLDAWRARTAVAADLVVRFGESIVLEGSMLYDRHRGVARIETAAGQTLVFDGERAWVSPASADVPMARFHLLTWPYFLAVPFKLRDPGTRLGGPARRWLGDRACETVRLTFESGTGDSPDDWYVVYADPVSKRLVAMAYIVTYGPTTVEQAQKEPHAIVYGDFQTVDGVTLARRWVFKAWDEVRGPHGEPIGDATLSRVRFVEPEADAFVKPPDAREDAMPAPSAEDAE